MSFLRPSSAHQKQAGCSGLSGPQKLFFGRAEMHVRKITGNALGQMGDFLFVPELRQPEPAQGAGN